MLAERVAGAAQRVMAAHSAVQQAQMALKRHLATLLAAQGGHEGQQERQGEEAEEMAGGEGPSSAGRGGDAGDMEWEAGQDPSARDEPAAAAEAAAAAAEAGPSEEALRPGEADGLYRQLGAQQREQEAAAGELREVAARLQVGGR